MKKTSYCLFETPLGACGIAWREPADSGSQPLVTAVKLPEMTPQATKHALTARLPKLWDSLLRLEKSVKLWQRIPCQSSFLAIGSLLPGANLAAFPLRAAPPPKRSSSPSKAPPSICPSFLNGPDEVQPTVTFSGAAELVFPARDAGGASARLVGVSAVSLGRSRYRSVGKRVMKRTKTATATANHPAPGEEKE